MPSFFDAIHLPELTTLEWLLVIVCALLVGISRAGLSGAGMAVVPVLASIFGGKASSGFLLPMLCFADLLAVRYYNQHAQWHHLLRLLPWTLAGIGIGAWIGDLISDQLFKAFIGGIVLICLGLMLWQDRQQKKITVPETWWFSGLVGLLGGFATMIGNASGPITALYLLSMHLPKNHYIGTAAWFFFIVNLIKLPFHIFLWETITPSSLWINVSLIPAIVAGAFAGIAVVRRFPESVYRLLMLITIAVSALLLFY